MGHEEDIWRVMVPIVNAQAAETREEAEARFGQVWDNDSLGKDFEVLGFAAPYVVVRKRDMGEVGALMFQHSPRFYYMWQADGEGKGWKSDLAQVMKPHGDTGLVCDLCGDSGSDIIRWHAMIICSRCRR